MIGSITIVSPIGITSPMPSAGPPLDLWTVTLSVLAAISPVASMIRTGLGSPSRYTVAFQTNVRSASASTSASASPMSSSPPLRRACAYSEKNCSAPTSSDAVRMIAFCAALTSASAS